MHWFQFLRLMHQENIYSQVWKNEKRCQKCFSLLRPLIFVVKDTSTKGLLMLHCADFVAFSYPGYELKYTDLIFMW